jgi:hypothetical protein
LSITPAAARIYTGARWRGFLSIEPLRRVHLAAFRAIAGALGSETSAICADSTEDVAEVFLEGGTQGDCVAKLRETLGRPQGSVEVIAPAVVAEAERRVPRVWYWDRWGVGGVGDWVGARG